MNTMNTKELNPVQRFFAKFNIWTKKKEEQIGPILSFLPVLIFFLGGSAVVAIYIISSINLLSFFPITIEIIGVIIVMDKVMSEIGEEYKGHLQIEKEKENLECLIGQAKHLQAKDTRADTSTVDQLLTRAQIEFMTEGEIQYRLEHIRETIKKLKEFVEILKTIRTKESNIQTLEQKCERLPVERREKENLEQEFQIQYS